MGAIGKFFDKHPLLACGALLVGLAALSASSDGEGEYCELTNGQKLDLSEALDSARWNFDPSITNASADGNSITFMLDDDSSETIPFYYDSGDWSSGSAESEAVDEAVGYILGCLR